MQINAFHGVLFFIIAFFIQIGGASTLSVSFVGFLFCFFIFLISYKNYFFDIISFSAAIFFANVLFFWNEGDIFGVLARAARVYVCFLIVCFAGYSNVKYCIPRNKILYGILIFQVTMFLLILVQFFAIKFGDPRGFFLPWEFYGNTAGDEVDGKRITTLPSYWLEFGADKGLLLGDEFKIRPSAAYSEPSYAGFLCLACFFVLSASGSVAISSFSFVLAIFSVGFCESASGLILISLFAAFKFKDKIFSDIRLIFLVLFLFFLAINFSDVGRILNAGNMYDESSGFIRIVKPVINILNQFGDGYVFGMPEYLLASYHSDYYNGVLIGKGLDNGLFNIVMTTGVFSPLVLFIIRRVGGLDFFVFFILGASINGSPFSFDKTFVFFIAAIFAKAIKN